MSTTRSKQRPAARTRWTVDAEGTTVDFAVKTFWGLATVRGRFDGFDGVYEVGPDGTRIALTIEANSLDTANRRRDEHLRSSDFFAVAEHPQVRFTSTRVRHAGDGRLRVEGVLARGGNRRAARVRRHRAAGRPRARGRSDHDRRPPAVGDDQRPARDDPPADDPARQGAPDSRRPARRAMSRLDILARRPLARVRGRGSGSDTAASRRGPMLAALGNARQTCGRDPAAGGRLPCSDLWGRLSRTSWARQSESRKGERPTMTEGSSCAYLNRSAACSILFQFLAPERPPPVPSEHRRRLAERDRNPRRAGVSIIPHTGFEPVLPP